MTGEYARMSDNAYICQARSHTIPGWVVVLPWHGEEGIEAVGNHAPPGARTRAPLQTHSDQDKREFPRGGG